MYTECFLQIKKIFIILHEEASFNDLDIFKVPNGVYVGEYGVDFIYTKVGVTVQNEVITNIDIPKYKNGCRKSAKVVAHRIMEEQK